MNERPQRNGRLGGTLFADLALWGGAALAVVSVHVGAVTWAMREPPVLASDGPPPAIMIELAPMPEATATEENELSEEHQDAQVSQAVHEVKAPEPLAEPVEREIAEDPSLEDVESAEDSPKVLPEKIDQEAEVFLPSSLRPKRRPERAKTVKPEAQSKPKRDPASRPQQASAASRSAVKAQNQQAQQSRRDAASRSAQGAGRSMSPARWQSRLMAHLERHKPGSNGERGQAYVTFRIDAAGNVFSIRLARSSGNAVIDQAAMNLVQRASPVPAPPPGIQNTVTVPVKFSRR